ncbi:MAG: DUF4032 domain-containing protein [Anaerolineae bacterium]|nr:MAG: DUF4032 domain-containing protein [Anaerolineae bacterium]
MDRPQITISLRPGHPDFLDLPWSYPLAQWPQRSSHVEDLPRGLSRHAVVFVNYDGRLYACKELPPEVAEQEYDLLRTMQETHLPVVEAVGHVHLQNTWGETSVLITRYLDYSLPYRSLFINSAMRGYQEHLLDAMAGLLVQLHLAGVYWGDCSLSNTLFRRDAGTLQAYLVDAETAEVHESLPPLLRHRDLKIMQENISGDLADLAASRLLPAGFPIFETPRSILERYQRLWEEITREEVIAPDESYRIQERIRALNRLGFSVGELQIRASEDGAKLRMRAFVTDRNFHRERLHSLTGLEAEEMQARKIMNEIQEYKATMSQRLNRNVPLSVAAYAWMDQIYQPVITNLQPLIDARKISPVEMYCQILEHKWYLSEKARRDVGHFAAVNDFMQKFYRNAA